MKPVAPTTAAMPAEKRLNRVVQEAALTGLSRTTLMMLHDVEGLPGYVLPGRGSRRIVLFDHDEVLAWLRERRDRQVRATLEGRRYQHRAVGRGDGS